jgi:hypothetical protein
MDIVVGREAAHTPSFFNVRSSSPFETENVIRNVTKVTYQSKEGHIGSKRSLLV